MIVSESEVCNSKNSRFSREKEASGLYSELGIKIPLLGDILLKENTKLF